MERMRQMSRGFIIFLSLTTAAVLLFSTQRAFGVIRKPFPGISTNKSEIIDKNSAYQADDSATCLPEDDSGALDITGASGNTGDTITITVRIQNAPNSVDSLGFDVTYDPAVLEYQGSFTRGSCVTNFSFFDFNLISAGTIRIGGFTTTNAIQTGASCDVVVLQFTVLTCATTSLGLQGLVDNIASWSKSGGCFSCGATTTTTPSVPGQTTTSTSAVSTTTTTSSGGGGSTTTTTSVPGQTTTSTSAISTTTTTALQCDSDTECDDGLFCTGIERCIDNVCTEGISPCADNETCDEDKNECVEAPPLPILINATCFPQHLRRPLVRAKRCLWLLLHTNVANHFNGKQSIITVTGPDKTSQGLEINPQRLPFNINNTIFIPVCIMRDAGTGKWIIRITTPFENTINSNQQEEVIEAGVEVKSSILRLP